MMRLFVERFLPTRASIVSPGVDEVRWILPVRPGDSLRIRVTVTEAARSRSKPDRGMTWVKPDLACQVKYAEWTQDNHLRAPVFVEKIMGPVGNAASGAIVSCAGPISGYMVENGLPCESPRSSSAAGPLLARLDSL